MNDSPILCITRCVSSPVNPSSTQLAPKQSLLVNRIRDLTRLGEEAGGRAYFDPMIGMNDPVRNVMEEMWPSPVARRLRTKRNAPAGRPGLIGVRDDGRIEQRGRFQRVFGQEIGAYQQAPLFGEVLARRQHIPHLLKAL